MKSEEGRCPIISLPARFNGLDSDSDPGLIPGALKAIEDIEGSALYYSLPTGSSDIMISSYTGKNRSYSVGSVQKAIRIL